MPVSIFIIQHLWKVFKMCAFKRVKLEDKDHLELLECLVLKDLMDPEDLQAAGAHLEQLECREWKE